MDDVEIRGEMIRLGNLLKYAGVADTGGEARELLQAEKVTVNGELEVRRGRQLHRGDVVTVGGRSVRVA